LEIHSEDLGKYCFYSYIPRREDRTAFVRARSPDFETLIAIVESISDMDRYDMDRPAIFIDKRSNRDFRQPRENF